MDRFLVPRLGFAVVIGLAVVLIGVMVLRGPDTHGNLWNVVRPDYVRTDLATLGGTDIRTSPAKVAFVLPEAGLGPATAIDPGKRIFIEAGCAKCHGVDARGAPVGPSLAKARPDTVRNTVREGPKGMPAFTKDQVSDDDVEKLVAYLEGLKVAQPTRP